VQKGGIANHVTTSKIQDKLSDLSSKALSPSAVCCELRIHACCNSELSSDEENKESSASSVFFATVAMKKTVKLMSQFANFGHVAWTASLTLFGLRMLMPNPTGLKTRPKRQQLTRAREDEEETSRGLSRQMLSLSPIAASATAG
jgi:hypothetical protein